MFGAVEALAEGYPPRPVYNPATKSYFQLFNDNAGANKGGRWDRAMKRAARKSYKGVRGRLAVVDSAEVHSFLQTEFALPLQKIKEGIWIGLRYWCSVRRLQWVSGDMHPPTAFKRWDRNWARNSRANCQGGGGYLPVYYTGGKRFRWQATLSAKFFKWYFVEFPTGAE